jgi:hypothetical protein
MLTDHRRTGSFDWTTDDPANSYVDEAGLHIVPTLTTATTNISVAQLTNGYVSFNFNWNEAYS